MKKPKYTFIFCFLALSLPFFSQNENTKWYFGNNAGLDFMTNPPTILINSAMTTPESCGSISDGAGNLLFYTDGVTVWNSLHQVMANGTGLMGNNSASQSGLIVKQPGNTNIYYIFTTDALGGPNGLRYSTVDMNLSAGLGAVTTKNILITPLSTEKLTLTRHCNGTDVWMVSHDFMDNVFRSTLITTAGVSPASVLSNAGGNIPSSVGAHGCMKISPTGRKLGILIPGYTSISSSVELFDFDNTSGIVSNRLVLTTVFGDINGCEFSPDGTKFYSRMWTQAPGRIAQWDLCAGSNADIINSIYTITNAFVIGQMQLAPDGKIYISKIGQSAMSVISNPNVGGVGCNYIISGQSISPNVCGQGLPQFLLKRIPPSPFTFAVNCSSVNFTAPQAACANVGYSITNMTWNFGDPSSGSNNTSNLNNPTHFYPGPGTYNAQLIYYYSCGGGTDTLKQTISVSSVSVTTSPNNTICSGQAVTLTASGNTTYTWSTGQNSSSISITPTINTTYTVDATDINGCINKSAQTISVLPVPLLTISGTTRICLGTTSSLSVMGANTFTWSNGSTNSILSFTPVANTIYTVTGESNAGCISQKTIQIHVDPVPVLSLAGGNTTTICSGTTLTKTVSGAVSYTWSTGSTGSAVNLAPTMNSTYSVKGKGANGCEATETFSITVITLPQISINHPLVCLGDSIVLVATTDPVTEADFIWNPGSYSGSSVIISPVTSQSYTLTTSISVCYTQQTTFVTVNPKPILQSSSNVIIEEEASITLTVSGGTNYKWEPTVYLSCNTCSEPVASPPQTTKFCVSSELNSCSSQTCLTVFVGCEYAGDLSVPNAFTPNGDGTNDAFCLQGWDFCINDFYIAIFNRWGEKVFESNKPDFCWDGLYKGNLLSSDVFVYVIKAMQKKNRITKKGNISLIR